MDENKSLSNLISEDASPEIKLKVLEYKLEQKKKKQDHEFKDSWQSCCFTVDKNMVMYSTQVGFISMISIFCIRQLIMLDSCTSQPYLGLLTLLIGVLTPQPTYKN
jgi:hypothetical protein